MSVLLYASALVVDLKELLRKLVVRVAPHAERQVRANDNVGPEPSAENGTVALLVRLGIAQIQSDATERVSGSDRPGRRKHARTSVYAAIVRFGAVYVWSPNSNAMPELRQSRNWRMWITLAFSIFFKFIYETRQERVGGRSTV